jgi:taurine transport system substrate-binding protein
MVHGWFHQVFRRRFLWLGLCAFGLAIAFSACTPNPTGTVSFPNGGSAPAQIRIGYQVIPNAELLVKAMGTVAEAFPNSKVEWKAFDSGRDVNTAMAANGLDLGLVGSTGTSIGIANQLPYQVYFIHDIIGDNEALVVRNSANIKAIPDLRGKKVAVPFGSTTHFSLLSALGELGVKANEVTVLDMQPADMLAAWQRGDIDAGFVWQPTLTRMAGSGGKILITAKDLYQQGIITADVGVAHRDFIRQYPDALKRYVALLDEAIQFYRTRPEEAAKVISPELGLSPQGSLKVMKELVWLTSEEQTNSKFLGTPESPGNFAQVLKNSATFMKAQGAIPAVPDMSVFQNAIYSQGLVQ